MISFKICSRCKKEIDKPGAILLGFPKNEVLCAECVIKDVNKRVLKVEKNPKERD